jgi:pimeloyl-ACP methyl ester carboxylesterase
LWPPQLRRLEGFHVYALDLPGHGRSSGEGYEAIADYADIVTHFVAALKLNEAALMGHSMGGAISQEIALPGPAWLSHLILVGTGARLPIAPALLTGIHTDFADTVQLACRQAFGPETPAEIVRRGEHYLRQVSPGVLRGDFLACDAFDVTKRLEGITVPTLIICGTEDRLTPPEYSKHLHDHIPGAPLVLVKGAGHMVMLEQPEVVAHAVASFLRPGARSMEY